MRRSMQHGQCTSDHECRLSVITCKCKLWQSAWPQLAARVAVCALCMGCRQLEVCILEVQSMGLTSSELSDCRGRAQAAYWLDRILCLAHLARWAAGQACY